jgi:hypothetical protein
VLQLRAKLADRPEGAGRTLGSAKVVAPAVAPAAAQAAG